MSDDLSKQERIIYSTPKYDKLVHDAIVEFGETICKDIDKLNKKYYGIVDLKDVYGGGKQCLNFQ